MKGRSKYLILGLVVTLVTTHIFINHERILIDGLSGEVWGVLRWPDTKYSRGYSHESFNEVSIGMTEKEVLKILGEPLVRWLPYDNGINEEKENWISFQYSDSPEDTHYRLRQILFNDEGVVEKKTGYFWVD